MGLSQMGEVEGCKCKTLDANQPFSMIQTILHYSLSIYPSSAFAASAYLHRCFNNYINIENWHYQKNCMVLNASWCFSSSAWQMIRIKAHW